MCYTGLDLERFCDAERNYNFVISTLFGFFFMQTCVLNIDIWMRNVAVWMRMIAYGWATDAYEYTRMHMDVNQDPMLHSE